MNIPKNLKYTKEHEWTSAKDNVVTVGITEFAVGQLGDITLVELPEVGEQITKEDTIGTIESVKAVSDMFAPVSGKVIEINEGLEDEPEKVNDDCYEAGWMLKVELSNPAELDSLMDDSGYTSFLDSLDD